MPSLHGVVRKGDDSTDQNREITGARQQMKIKRQIMSSGRPMVASYKHRYLHTLVAFNGNHDAKRVALDLLLILISGAPLNHAGRTQA
ncbi:hypothetical protein CRN80_01795 [Pseudomonas sp. FDAARGOS_380]|nr:hypothetical protein CRN80_01795 [Pseudomonas sp. FDAARGOS_380]